MKVKAIVVLVVVSFFVAIGYGVEEQPKRVMNFLAVMNLNCGDVVTKQNCTALTDVVIDELVKVRKYTVIDRANRDKILSEAGFQMTGCVDERCTVEAGRILGVGKIVVGSISKLGETLIVNLQLVNVETAAVENSSRETCKGCVIDDLLSTIVNAARNLMGETTTPISTQSPAMSITAPRPSPIAPSVPGKLVNFGVDPSEVDFAALLMPDEKDKIKKGKVVLKELTFVDSNGKVRKQFVTCFLLTVPEDFFWSVQNDFANYDKNFGASGQFRLVKKEENKYWVWQHFQFLFVKFEHVFVADYLKDKNLWYWQLDSNYMHTPELRENTGFVKIAKIDDVNVVFYSIVLNYVDRVLGQMNTETVERHSVETVADRMLKLKHIYEKQQR